MSHFTVLVVGPDPEKQLAPYHEYECTGRDDEYVQDVDITAEVMEQVKKYAAEPREKGDATPLQRALEYHGIDRRIDNESKADRNGKHKYGYAVVVDGILVKAVNRTNPNKKWDWYQIGGRWTGYFKLRKGFSGEVGRPGILTEEARAGYADQCIKGAIDIEGMRKEREAEFVERWDQFHAVWDKYPGSKTWRQFADITDDKQRREVYFAQPVIKALYAAKVDPFDDYDDYLVPREVYAKQGRDTALTSFAVVKDGKWYERGEMGWWGVVHDEKERDRWDEEFTTLFNSLPDDTLLTVVDCHI